MNTTLDYLHHLSALDRRQGGTGSDYSLANRLDITRQRISCYRNERSGFDDDLCIRVARMLKLPAGEVLANIHGSREKSPSARKAWDLVAQACKKRPNERRRTHRAAA